MSSTSISEETITALSEIFQMLSDPSRLKILLGLARGGAMNVTALRQLLAQTQPNVSQPAVSHHLSLLRKTRLVHCERQGKECHYRLDAAKLSNLLEQLFNEMGNSNRQIQLEDLLLSLKRR
jgi:DNA-binding transcriptional ArsR family regulator